MVDALPMRIFLASPSDLLKERALVRKCVNEYNANEGKVSRITYDVVGMEQVRGTARRPQSAINELIGESHFVVALFRRDWGSAPGSPWGYTSGTEEELFTGLIDLARLDRPMRDVWVGFLNHSNPDPRVSDLRKQVVAKHSMYYEALRNPADLVTKLTERLRNWALLASHKAPQYVELLPSSGKEVLKAAGFRSRGETLIGLGETAAGRSLLHDAATIGGPDEALSYARFLARQGELDEALEWTQAAIDYFSAEGAPLFSAGAAQAFAAQAGIMRRQRRGDEAVGRLDYALTLIRQDDAYSNTVKSRVLDDLGLTKQELGETVGARAAFEAALAFREEASDPAAVGQSRINLARLHVKLDELALAAEHADAAVALLRPTPLLDTRANAELLVAQVRLREGRPDDGVAPAQSSLALNRQIGSRRGEAMALLVLAQLHRAAGRMDEARTFAKASLQINEAMSDQYGIGKAEWILERLNGEDER